jgi:hypothetical protein
LADAVQSEAGDFRWVMGNFSRLAAFDRQCSPPANFVGKMLRGTEPAERPVE